MLNVAIQGDRELIVRLEEMNSKLHDALLRKVWELSLRLEAKVKAKLSDDVLHVRTGALRRSIFSEVDDQGTAIFGKVASGGDVKYAAIQEFGGVTAPHDIIPTTATALAFMAGESQVFAKVVHHPGSVIPERSYLRSSLAEMETEIIAELTAAVAAGVGE